MNSLVAELVQVCGKEWALLEQCKDFLSMLAAMQVRAAFCSTALKHLPIQSLKVSLFHLNFFSLLNRSRLSTVV